VVWVAGRGWRDERPMCGENATVAQGSIGGMGTVQESAMRTTAKRWGGIRNLHFTER